MMHPSVELALMLIRCPSVTPLEAGALGVLEAVLAPAGFRCQRMAFGEGDARVDNLVAEWGSEGAHLGFAGHVDVVPPGDLAAWSVSPFLPEIRDGHLIGRGAEDMKSAIAAFAVAAIDYARNHQKGRLSLIITCDEEADATYGTDPVMQELARQGRVPDACLVGEPTNPEAMGQMAKIGRRGSYSAQITVHGVQGHVAYPQLADNPVPKLVRILNQLQARRLDDGDAYFQPSNMEITSVDVGNMAGNVIPAKATAKLNVRFNTNHTPEELAEWVEATCREHAADYEVKHTTGARAFFCQPGKLAESVIRAVERCSGRKPELSTTGGTSDARFIQRYCPVVEYGTTGRTSHKVDENVRVEDIVVLMETYRQVIEEFMQPH